jgi:hypothetical protein
VSFQRKHNPQNTPMNELAKIAKFRQAQEPVPAFWTVCETEVFGSFTWSGNRPSLRLIFETSLDIARAGENADHPVLVRTRPPVQVSISSSIPALGFLTLEECARSNVVVDTSFSADKARYTLAFLPTRIWLGSKKGDVEGRVSEADVFDSRIVGFFGSPGFMRYGRSSRQHEEAFRLLGQPEEIWTINPSASPWIKLGETGFSLRVASIIERGFSAVAGGQHSVDHLFDI